MGLSTLMDMAWGLRASIALGHRFSLIAFLPAGEDRGSRARPLFSLPLTGLLGGCAVAQRHAIISPAYSRS